MGQLCPYEGEKVAITYISRARAIFLLFCVHRDTSLGSGLDKRHWWIFEWPPWMCI